MFDRPSGGERTILVHVQNQGGIQDPAELQELANSAGAVPVAAITARRHTPDPRHYLGRGKVEELQSVIREHDAGLVLFDCALTPAQERNLEKTLNTRVVDRTGLILDIFAQRARSFEGKLQVELAQLRHLSTRLVRGWTHLERQKGGIGLRGPGETQLESDKRLIANRIRQIQKRLDKVSRQREQGRCARKKAFVPVVGLVGYTNAGKSTLFNALTRSDVYAADQLFATLDPTLRRHALPGNLELVLADTVGFIRDLPHELIAAFRSTLSEAVESDLLLHVVDASDEAATDKMREVESVLNEIGAEDVPCIQVFNKIDCNEDGEPRCERDDRGRIHRIWLSARSGAGLGLLDQALEEFFGTHRIRRTVQVDCSDAALRAKLYRLGRVLEEEADGRGGWIMQVEMERRDWHALEKEAQLTEPPEFIRDVAA